ncbi:MULTISPECIES: hypothetical protein [unclassified Brevibacillus]|uniref:hypothetical protein n=1 Tax=unclassified Brevibacillus TaxID=2684853 RepID=UPI003563C71E
MKPVISLPLGSDLLKVTLSIQGFEGQLFSQIKSGEFKKHLIDFLTSKLFDTGRVYYVTPGDTFIKCGWIFPIPVHSKQITDEIKEFIRNQIVIWMEKELFMINSSSCDIAGEGDYMYISFDIKNEIKYITNVLSFSSKLLESSVSIETTDYR